MLVPWFVLQIFLHLKQTFLCIISTSLFREITSKEENLDDFLQYLYFSLFNNLSV